MIIRILFISLLFLAAPTIASDSFKDEHHKVTLISGYDGIGGLKTITMGLKFELTGEWHTYYRHAGCPVPGIGGVKVDFSESKNVKNVTTLWPAPVYCNTFGLNVYGYKDTAVIPLKVELIDPSKEAVLNFKLTYQICDPGNCLKDTSTVTKTLEVSRGGAVANENLKLIKDFERRVPLADTGRGFTIKNVKLDTSKKDKYTITVVAHNHKGFHEPLLFIEPQDKFYVDKPNFKLSKDGKKVTFVASVYANEKKQGVPSENLIGSKLIVTVKDGKQSVQGTKAVKKG